VPDAFPIQSVSDTARWVAMYRAHESERKDAIFHDPFARTLAGPEGAAILKAIPRGRQTSWPLVVRTAVFDEVVLRYVREQGATAVLNLAAGLDARPWRLPLPESLRWVDVDFAPMLDYKRQAIGDAPSKCRYEARPADLRDPAARRALFAGFAVTERVLVVAEGLLIYLDEPEVAALARDLASNAAFRWWLIDYVSPPLLKRLQKTWGQTLGRGNAPLKFAPTQGVRYFAPLGWNEREFHSTWADAKRLRRRMPSAWLYDLLIGMAPPHKQRAMQRFAGNVVLERAPV